MLERQRLAAALAKLAFGVGSGDARLRRLGILKCLGFLAVYSGLLDMALELKVMDADLVKRLDARRGRAHFYVQRFFEASLGSGPRP